MKVTKIDYLIYIGSVFVFVYFFFFVGAKEHISEYGWRTLEYSSAVIIAPIISIAWLLMLLWGEDIPRLRDIDFNNMIKTKIHILIREERKRQKEWKNRRLQNEKTK